MVRYIFTASDNDSSLFSVRQLGQQRRRLRERLARRQTYADDSRMSHMNGTQDRVCYLLFTLRICTNVIGRIQFLLRVRQRFL